MPFLRLCSFLVLILFTACSEKPETMAPAEDIFSYANNGDVTVRHIDLDLAVNFEEKALEGTAKLNFERLNPEATALVLDTRDIDIRGVTSGGEEVSFTLDERDPVLGQKLEIQLPEGADSVTIAYKTSPGATGLQWLPPEQTAGKQYPFLFSQSQAIHARSWVPLQDSPSVRFTYSAHIKTPPELIAVMSAAQDPDGVRDGDYTFEMPQAIPSYLMAIAVGDLEFRPISENVGILGENYIVDAAAKEFEETPKMVDATGKLYGPYRWGRYDILVLPPSFPFGGMENPRLTFLTPTVIAGDKSQTNVIAHELAHSWAGNQVTNASWREPWLNEGITSYVENRIVEEVYGRERAVMEQVLAKADWMSDLADIDDPAMSALKLPEVFADPDLGFSNVAYSKGEFFMIFLEQSFGREVFDPFLKGYFDYFSFQSITTEDFRAYLKANLLDKNPGGVDEAVIEEWLYGPGVPETTPNPVSPVFEEIDGIRAGFLDGTLAASDFDNAGWSTHEWLYFLNGLPGDMPIAKLEALDAAHDLSHAGNAEIAVAWYLLALEGGYQPVMEPLHDFLVRVGRGKFLYPLYTRLIETGHQDWAVAVFAEAEPGYHPIAQAGVRAILGEN